MVKLGLGILIGLTAVRYWICLQAPVFPFEAYLHMCTRRLDAAFFDGPAGPATLVYLGNKLFTNDLLAFRWSAPLFSILATVACYFLGKKLYGIPAGLAATLFLNILPGFQIGSIQLENTLPALAFWLLGILFIWNALKTFNCWWWSAAGICLALGLQFSYWVLLAPISCLCILGKRSHLSRSSFSGWGILLLFCLLGLAGPIEWNIRQNWLPFTGWTWQTLFHLENWHGALSKLLREISLPGAVLALISIALCLQSAHRSLKTRFLAAFIIPPLVVTLFLITRSEAGPILFTLAPLFVWLGGWWQTATSPNVLPPKYSKHTPLSWATATTSGLIAFCSMITLMAWPSFSDKGLQKAAITVEKIARTQNIIFPSPLGEIFFIGETPAIVTEFGYIFEQLGGKKSRFEIFLRESPDLSNQFRLWPSYCDFSDVNRVSDPLFTEQKGINRYLGRSALYITPDKDFLPQTISAAFQKIIPLQTLQIFKNGKSYRQLYIYLCRNYQTLPL